MRRERRDVFVSYAREDKRFVGRLRERLEAGGKKVYLDVRDIPKWSEDWQVDVYAQIEACDTFLCVLSPHSVRSDSVRLELQHAVQQGKRLKPLLVRDVDDSEVPEALGTPQWIDFTETRQFEAQFAQLLGVLETDVKWVRGHTRFQLAANEWDARGEDSSLLLVRSNLRDAEEWLAGQAGKEPRPTDLQNRFILASQKGATWRRRITFGLILLALMVTAGLAVFAFIQRNEAVDQRDRALSRSLATQAMDRLDQNRDLAALLALEAYRTKPTIEARDAVLTALESDERAKGALRGHTGEVNGVAFSPDGEMLASTSRDRTMRLWELATQRARGKPGRGLDFLPTGPAFSPDGSTLAVGNNRRVRLWDLDNHEWRRRPFKGHKDTIWGVAFSPDGKTLAAATHKVAVRMWRVPGQRRPRHRPVHATISTGSVAFSPNGQRLAVSGQSGLVPVVGILNLSTNRWDSRPLTGHAGGPLGIAFSPDGKTLASSSGNRKVWLWKVASGRPVGGPPMRHTGPVSAVGFSPRGETLASGGDDRTVRLWDTATHRPLGPPLRGHSSRVVGVAFSPDGKTLASAGDDRTVRLWDVGPRPPLSRRLPGHRFGVADVAFSPDGETLASAGLEGMVRLWEVATGDPRGEPILASLTRISTVSFGPEGKTVVAAGFDGSVESWNVATHDPHGDPLEGHVGEISSLVFSPDGETLAWAGEDPAVRLWDTNTDGPRRRTPAGHADGVNGLAFSPDGERLASAGVDETVRLWDVQTRERVGRPLTGHLDQVLGVSFSPDGEMLASASSDGTVRVWDVANRDQLGQPLEGHIGSVNEVAFTPDGQTLASAGADRTVRLWDVDTHRPLGVPLRGHRAAVQSVAFSAGGKALASSSEDRTVRLWDPILWSDSWDALRARVCARVRRNLSRADWAEFLPERPYTETCP